MNLKTWITGTFLDSAINKFLGIDGEREAPMLFVGTGSGTGSAIPKKMLAHLK